ncbi:MAG: hypothetical protein IJU86_04605, partial [Firmicutes bacterium]|nr:hypothetical protein [Bacillota bacterium]
EMNKDYISSNGLTAASYWYSDSIYTVKTEIKINTDKKVVKAAWLDNGKRVRIKKNAFMPDPFFYGYSGSVRILRFELEG